MKRRGIASVLLLMLSVSSSLSADDLRVGAAAVNLEADDSMVIAGGIGPGKAQGQEGELRVTAVVFEKPGQGKFVIAAVDVLFLTRDFVDRALAEVERTTGIPPAHVLINATHTHHAPSVTVVHGYGVDRVFQKRIEDGIVMAIQDANARLTDNCRFFFHLGEERTVGANSRLLMKDNQVYWIGPMTDAAGPTGPFDPQLPVLAFKDPADKLRALVFNHSTHTIGTVKGAVRSPSFYGLAAQDLERELGGTVCFLEGASGSTHNITPVPAGMAVVRMKAAVRGALAQAEARPVDRIASVKRPFKFTVRRFGEAVEEQKVMRYLARYAPSHADAIAPVFRDMRKQLSPLQGQERETWLQAMVIGDVALVGVPAEYFTALGVDIKRRSPFKHTYVAELANDWIGYLPDRQGHEMGGYQTWMGQHSFAEIGTGERVADEVVAMLNELAGAKR
jgi:hypothetical protein